MGDDVYGEDPTVDALQERVAELFGKEDALFTPTGSMANVLAVASLVAPGQEVLCEASAHIARAELGAHGAVTGLTMRTWRDPRGQVDLAAIERLYAPDMGPFFVRTAAVSVENTHNFAGGAVLPLDGPPGAPGLGRRRSASASTSTARGSGTRTSRPASRSRRTARAPTCCRSACRRGSAPRSARWSSARADAIAEARVRRKRMGGGMRQVGILAAAGLHALDHHVERLADDHAHARLLAEACGVDPETVDTNIVVVPRDDAAAFVAGAATVACWSHRSARPPSGWSPTSTSAGTTPRLPRRCCRSSEPARAIGAPAGTPR